MGRDIGRKVRELRKQRRLSQSELALKAGIAQSTLSYVESGKKEPQFDTLSSICKGLGISVLELLSYDEPASGKKLFEQQKRALAGPGGGVPFCLPRDLPVEALKELYEFQKYLDHKYRTG